MRGEGVSRSEQTVKRQRGLEGHKRVQDEQQATHTRHPTTMKSIIRSIRIIAKRPPMGKERQLQRTHTRSHLVWLGVLSAVKGHVSCLEE
ncbi:hypothetical protein Ddc_02361 [Ditylenchus destructor]|nr:hypothetical protein Ddc_02361 [Ditylenchus destructor]